MKRSMLCVTALMAAMALSACSQSAAETEAATTASTEAATAAETEAAAEELSGAVATDFGGECPEKATGSGGVPGHRH